jgi:hypothetical protein
MRLDALYYARARGTAKKLLEKSIDTVMALRIKALQKTKKIPENGPELYSLTSSPSLPGR